MALSDQVWNLSSHQKAVGSEQENGASQSSAEGGCIESIPWRLAAYSYFIYIHVLRDLRI